MRPRRQPLLPPGALQQSLAIRRQLAKAPNRSRPICALQQSLSREAEAKRINCKSRARTTLSRMVAELSGSDADRIPL